MTSGQDKVFDHTREQLSALFDGELAPDEGRFLQRRLQHDGDLAGCVSRWQSIGDVLRGQAAAPAPAGFPARVAAAVAAEPVAPGRSAPGMQGVPARRRWIPGVALAASVAMVGWFAMRQAPDAALSSHVPAAQLAQAHAPPPAPRAAVPAQPGMPAPDSAGQLATAAVAAAEVPRRLAARRNPSRAQVQRAATTRAARQAQDEAGAQLAVASAAPAVGAVAGPAEVPANPFAPSPGAMVSRPWPRALLPGANGVFNVGYGSLQRGGEPFHPFRPQPVPAPVQMQVQPQVQPDQALPEQ